MERKSEDEEASIHERIPQHAHLRSVQAYQRRGVLIQYHWSNTSIFLAVAVPALISALMLFLMSRESGTDVSTATAAAAMEH